MKSNKNNDFLKKILSNSLGSKSYVSDIDYGYFNNLKNDLLKRYDGKSLQNIDGAMKIETDYGETLKVTSSEKVDFEFEECDFKNSLYNNLKLIPGIGPNKEITLKNNGFDSINDLKSHDSYCNHASKIIEIIENNSFNEILDLLNKNKYSKKCRDNVIKSLSLVEKENFRFMDIETLGLSNVPLILIGVAEIKNDVVTTSQYFLEDTSQEKAAIDSYLSHIDEESIHVTFNGASFDIPFIKNRSNFHGLDCSLDQCHFDLIYFVRALWKDKLPNCKLATIEKEIFNISRDIDVPGSEIPDYYKTYLAKNNIGPIIPIIEHNKQDIVSLSSFLMRIYEESSY